MSSRGVPASSFPGNPRGAGGPSGYGFAVASPDADVSLGGSLIVDSGWALDGSSGDAGLSIVSDDLHYAPGIYVVNYYWSFDTPGWLGSETLEVEFSDVLIGSDLRAWRGDFRQLLYSGWGATDADASAEVQLKYVSGPSSTSIHLNSVYVSALRVAAL